jgi:poly-gamma-glutamate capsule biosynthesis protein CapA/YwtB (metallophosphatase superfamily)
VTTGRLAVTAGTLAETRFGRCASWKTGLIVGSPYTMNQAHSHMRILARRFARAVSLTGLVVFEAIAVASAGTPPPGGVRVCAGGDVTLGTDLDTGWTNWLARESKRGVPIVQEPERLLAPLSPLLTDADIVLVNVEGAIGGGAAPPAKCPPNSKNCYMLRQPLSAAPALRTLAPHGVVIGNLANNHSHDAGDDGVDSTAAHLAAAGVLATGMDTLPTVVATSAGDTVAFLGFGFSGPPDVRDLEAVRRHVSRAAARYPRLVVTAHLGAEGRTALRTRDTAETFLDEDRGNPVAFARTAASAGASLVVGHGPHVVRAAEWQGDALIAYSLGNLVTFGPFSLKPPLDRAVIACATLDRAGKVTSAVLRPTRQLAPGIARPDRTGRALVLVDSLGRLDFPASAVRLFVEGVIRHLPPRSGQIR